MQSDRKYRYKYICDLQYENGACLKDSVIEEACKTRAELIDLHNFIAKGFQQRQEMMSL